MSGDAVVFIPGIKGTKLLETNVPTWDTIWSALQSNFETIEHLEPTVAFEGEYYDERIQSLVKPGEIETLAYGEFLRGLNAPADTPIYIFSYDWRLSARINGERLGAFLDYLVAKSAAIRGTEHAFTKFDFITHSLGSHVLRAYLSTNTTERFRRVNRIVFTVPPFAGAIDIVGAALIGEGWFPQVKAKVRKLIRVMPGALELLPRYPQASVYEPKGPHSFFRFGDWQGNVRKPGRAATKMRAALADAKNTIDNVLVDLRALTQRQRERILVIARDGFETYQSIRVLVKSPDGIANFVDFANACQTSDGDGRVPHVSSCVYFDDVLTLMLDDAFWYQEYSHGFVLKDERVEKMVNRFLFTRGKFKWHIPGGSVRRVKGLVRKVDAPTKLPYWVAV